MDRLIYTAGSGAKHILDRQATTANNLANVTTTGFRAQIDSFRAVPVVAEGTLPTRAFVVNSTVASDFSSGPLQLTGRDLDVAIKGKGFIAVQMADGSEAYPRNGALQMNENGLLTTTQGFTVQGDGVRMVVDLVRFQLGRWQSQVLFVAPQQDAGELHEVSL